jgi:Flp pilus assembly pilin Flp
VRHLYNYLLRLQIWKDTHGQDLIEYSLLAAFIAVAGVATFPPVANSISTIFSKISSSMQVAISES